MVGQKSVLVVVGAGAMGNSIVRRLGSSAVVVLADTDAVVLAETAEAFAIAGYETHSRTADITSAAAVAELAEYAASLGPVTRVALTAGLVPSYTVTPRDLFTVDLVGVAHVLDAFGEVIAPGGAGVVIASMAGHMLPPLQFEQQLAIAGTPAADLLTLPFLNPDYYDNAGVAYAMAKQASLIRVRAASVRWGRRSARVNSISPGTISSAATQQELSTEHAGADAAVVDGIRDMISRSPIPRMGTSDEIAAVAEFLLGPGSSFVTGTDVLVDGGAVASTLLAGVSS
ncbi:SDR family oxidoreductase [Mycobacterium sp. 48b]|uniref:SDR family oxidoreductase n=1 Tax=Mycobacterium sp. 48b TaxID=3400426 RepID=UPI003AAF62F5